MPSVLFPTHVEFPATNLAKLECHNLICRRALYQMDSARLLLAARHDQLRDHVGPGSPLRITWGGINGEDEFIGYVHSISPVSDGPVDQTVIYAVSAAYPMVTRPGRSFVDHAIHNIAATIADDYRFQSEIDPHAQVHEQTLQLDLSDWSFLVRLAREWGYVLMLDGVTLMFRELESYLRAQYKFGEVEKTSREVVPGFGTNIVYFAPDESVDHTTTETFGAGIASGSGSPFEWQVSGDSDVTDPFADSVTGRALSSDLEAELVAEAVGAAKRRFKSTAEATFFAPSGKKPLDVYHIEHRGKKKTWVIMSVTHYVGSGNYLAEMVLNSDDEDYSRVKSRQNVDMDAQLERKRMVARPDPVLTQIQPYFVGRGTKSLVSEQRWRAELIRPNAWERRLLNAV